MSDVDKPRDTPWVSLCMVVPALLVSGATMAFMFLAVPLFFAFFVAIYGLKFTLEIWAWRNLSQEERCAFRAPFGLMNFNFALSVKMEWIVFLTGFCGLLLWVH
ncbi:MAG: hypothetical protein AAFS01_15015 [Pseudomonadota bacterium]